MHTSKGTWTEIHDSDGRIIILTEEIELVVRLLPNKFIQADTAPRLGLVQALETYLWRRFPCTE